MLFAARGTWTANGVPPSVHRALALSSHAPSCHENL